MRRTPLSSNAACCTAAGLRVMAPPLPGLFFLIAPIHLAAAFSIFVQPLLPIEVAHIVFAVASNWLTCSLSGYAFGTRHLHVSQRSSLWRTEINLPLMREFGFSVPVLGTLVASSWVYSHTTFHNPLHLFALFFLTFFSSLAIGIRSATVTYRALTARPAR